MDSIHQKIINIWVDYCCFTVSHQLKDGRGSKIHVGRVDPENPLSASGDVCIHGLREKDVAAGGIPGIFCGGSMIVCICAYIYICISIYYQESESYWFCNVLCNLMHIHRCVLYTIIYIHNIAVIVVGIWNIL